MVTYRDVFCNICFLPNLFSLNLPMKRHLAMEDVGQVSYPPTKHTLSNKVGVVVRLTTRLGLWSLQNVLYEACAPVFECRRVVFLGQNNTKNGTWRIFYQYIISLLECFFRQGIQIVYAINKWIHTYIQTLLGPPTIVIIN